VLLFAFNLLPAFPMDGGRVLRALLAYRLDYATATRIAAGVGQFMAVLFLIAGVLWNFWLIIIAFFVYIAAQAESQMAEFRGGLSGLPVRDAMITDFVTLSPEDTLERASEALLAGTQQDFPVVASGNFLGILARADLYKALSAHGLQARVGDVARRNCPAVSEYDMLYRVFQMMQEADCPIVPVVRAGEIVGLVTLENIGELLMIRSALRQLPRKIPAAGKLAMR
jgi:CBS domain-containing protein